MGLFEKFSNYKESRRQSRLAKASKSACNPKAIKEDRMGSLQFLASLEDCNEAVPALLPRFDFSLEHGIVDTREKEVAMEGILSFEKSALPFLSDWIKTSGKIAWPIKIVKKIGSDEEVVDILKQAVVFGDVSFDQEATDKNYDILCYLRDYKIGDFAKKLVPFLSDPNERVRFACAEVLVEQGSDEFVGELEPFIADSSSENIRIHQVVVKAFSDNQWKINDLSKIPEGFSSPGVTISKDGGVKVNS